MKRYCIVNGVPVLPPCDAVSADGRVLSNFAVRVEHDAAFAAAHGYYPIKEEAIPGAEELLEAEERFAAATASYELRENMWVRTVK